MPRVPLVRVEGKKYVVRPDLSMTAERFAQGERLDPEARDQIARDAEDAYALGDSLYFYAGYASPGFGDVALAYEPELSDGLAGNASTFDTGGMFKGYIHGSGLTTPAERAEHVKDDLCELDQWRPRFDAWVAEHFPDVAAYLGDTKPVGPDPSGRLQHPSNTRHAWTFEVRLHAGVELFERLAFAIVRQDFLQQALAHAAASEPWLDRLLDLVNAGRLAPSDPDEPCAMATRRSIAYAAAAAAGGPA
jgi:hypothetical protein